MESCSAHGPNVFFQQVIYPTNKNHDILFLDAMLGVRLVPLAPKIQVAPAERLQSGGLLLCWDFPDGGTGLEHLQPGNSLNKTRPPNSSYRKTRQNSTGFVVVFFWQASLPILSILYAVASLKETGRYRMIAQANRWLRLSRVPLRGLQKICFRFVGSNMVQSFLSHVKSAREPRHQFAKGENGEQTSWWKAWFFPHSKGELECDRIVSHWIANRYPLVSKDSNGKFTLFIFFPGGNDDLSLRICLAHEMFSCEIKFDSGVYLCWQHPENP